MGPVVVIGNDQTFKTLNLNIANVTYVVKELHTESERSVASSKINDGT